MNKQQEPRLRFQGFTGAWEEKKVIDFSPLQRGFDLPVSKIIEGDYPVVFSNGILKSHNQYKVKGVGIVTGRSGTIGEVTFVEKDFWPHNTALWVTNFFGNNPQFVFHFLKNFDLSRFATGSGVPTLNRNDVHNQTIYVPKFEEQTAIGNFFRRLDSLIAESRAVLEKSRQLKKAMLAEMFPTNGEKIPKIRFKGFEGEWESRKLGEISDFAKGKGLSKSSIDSNGNTPCILYGELYTKYDCYINKVFSSTNEKIENPILTKSNDVLLPTSDVTPNGLAKACSIYFDDIVLGGDILVIRSTEMFGLFFAHYVESNPFMIIEKATGTTVFHIYEKDLRDIVLLLPSYEEQTAIGNFFRQLDETIALQSAEVEKLNQLKKGLLAAMLV